MVEKIEIILNGKKETVPGGWTLERLVQDLKLESEQIAIELNGQIVNRKGWSQQAMGQGDRVEIVHFVGGGERKEKCPIS